MRSLSEPALINEIDAELPPNKPITSSKIPSRASTGGFSFPDNELIRYKASTALRSEKSISCLFSINEK